MANLSVKEVKSVIKTVLNDMQLEQIPIGISNHHVHLCPEHFKQLFPNESIRPLKMLKQPGEFAAIQTVTVVGPKGELEKVRILGPLRQQSQVELSQTDSRQLGLDAPIRLSGNLADASPVTLKSEHGAVTFKGAIVAKRHIHMSVKQLADFGFTKGECLDVLVETPERATIFREVELRVGENFVLEMHVDTDEANASAIQPTTTGKVINR
jgi:phosphate propanoyltransferase